MAIIMVHHMATINAQCPGFHAIATESVRMAGIADMAGIGFAFGGYGNSASLVMSHALMPSPAPVARYAHVSAQSANKPAMVMTPSRPSTRSKDDTADLTATQV